MELGKEVGGAHTQSWGCFQVVSWQGCRDTKNKAFFATGRKSEWGLKVGLEPLYNQKKSRGPESQGGSSMDEAHSQTKVDELR